jgi:hypothetical protein
MRHLVEERIRSNWLCRLEEMTGVAYTMGWEHDYEGHNSLIVNGRKLTIGVVDDNLNRTIWACSEEALLHWLRAQHCQQYR